MAIIEYVELGPRGQNTFIGVALTTRDDGVVPEYQGARFALPTAGRTDAPFVGRIYDQIADLFSDAPAPPVILPTRAEEIRDRDITGPPPTQTDTFEACQEILKLLLP